MLERIIHSGYTSALPQCTHPLQAHRLLHLHPLRLGLRVHNTLHLPLLHRLLQFLLLCRPDGRLVGGCGGDDAIGDADGADTANAHPIGR